MRHPIAFVGFWLGFVEFGFALLAVGALSDFVFTVWTGIGCSVLMIVCLIDWYREEGKR